MKYIFLSLFLLSSVTLYQCLKGSENSYNFDECLPGRQLLRAAISGKKQEVKRLLEEDASLVGFVDFYGRTVLHMAIANNRFAIAHMLIDSGSLVDVPDRFGRTPLMTAVFLPNDPEAALLLCRRLQKKGANLDNADHNLNNPLMFAAVSTVFLRSSYNELFNFLLKNTSDLDQISHDKSTALHYASMSGNSNAVLQLLLDGAKVSSKNYKDETAYDIASKRGYTQIQEMLSNPYLGE